MGILTASFMLANPSSFAQSIGEEMPKFDYKDLYMVKTWESTSYLKRGILIFLDRNKDGKADVTMGYVECGEKLNTLPFGVYDSFKEKLYLDNSPTDGKIDKIFEKELANERNAIDDAPECNTI